MKRVQYNSVDCRSLVKPLLKIAILIFLVSPYFDISKPSNQLEYEKDISGLLPQDRGAIMFQADIYIFCQTWNSIINNSVCSFQ